MHTRGFHSNEQSRQLNPTNEFGEGQYQFQSQSQGSRNAERQGYNPFEDNDGLGDAGHNQQPSTSRGPSSTLLDYLQKKFTNNLRKAIQLYEIWLLAGHSENSLRAIFAAENPKTASQLQLRLVRELSKVESHRIPESVFM